MKGYVCLLSLLMGAAVCAQSQMTPAESAVLLVQRQWLEASQKGDDGALRQIIDDHFVGSTPDNHIINKQSLFPTNGSKPTFTNTEFDSLEANVIGNTAVVFGNMITAGESTALRCAMVYRRQAGTWKMIAAQLVPVPDTTSAKKP